MANGLTIKTTKKALIHWFIESAIENLNKKSEREGIPPQSK